MDRGKQGEDRENIINCVYKGQMLMRINAIIQARCGSTRFPNKIFADIDGKPLLYHVVNRLKFSELINDIIIATTVNPKDDVIEKWCDDEQVYCFRGSENDVLNRYFCAAISYPSDIIVRVTADDPFKEPAVIDLVIRKLIEEQLDLVTNNFPPSYPEGLDCEAFTFAALKQMEEASYDEFEREHVTQYIYHNTAKFRIGNIMCPRQLSSYRWTIDTLEDLQMVNAIYSQRKDKTNGILLMDEILKILDQHPEIVNMNKGIKRSTMYQTYEESK